jgi:hypothetical protein
MAEEIPTAKETKELFVLSRKRAISFGLCLGKKPETSVLILDKKKAPAILMRMAKKAGETTKLAYGTIESKGKEVTLTCEGKIPPGLAKRLRLYLKSISLPGMSITVLDAAGGLQEEEGDDEAQAETPKQSQRGTSTEEPLEQKTKPSSAQEQAQDDDPDGIGKDLKLRTEELRKEALAIGGKSAEKLVKAVDLAARQVQETAFQKAELMLVKIETALKKLADTTAQKQPEEIADDNADGDEQKNVVGMDLARRAQDLKLAAEAVGGKSAEKLIKAVGMAAKQIRASENRQAEHMLTKIEAALKKLSGSGSTAKAAESQASQADTDSAASDLQTEARGKRVSAMAALEKNVDELLAQFA